MASRVGAILSHLNSAPVDDGPIATTGAAPDAATVSPERLLTEAQLKEYLVNGFIVIKPDDLPTAREAFADQFYSKVRDLVQPDEAAPGQRWRGGDGENRDEALWEMVSPDINAVLGAPSVKGALTTLLGPDFLAPPGNSLMHVSGPNDQTYHRDGTDHGPTMPTVRDHRLRHVIVMFYPLETTVDLGPT